MMARDFENLLQVGLGVSLWGYILKQYIQCSIAVFDGLFPEPHNQIVMELLFSMAHWHGMAKLHMHHDLILDELDELTKTLGASLHYFSQNICILYDTKKLQEEYDAHIFQAATSESEPGDGLSDENNEEQMESDDLDYMAGHQGPNSDSDVDIGKIQLSSTGQLSILAPKPSSIKGSARSRGRPKKTNVRMTWEESKSDDDIPGESNLVLLIIHVFIVYMQHLSTSFMRSMIAIEDLDVT